MRLGWLIVGLFFGACTLHVPVKTPAVSGLRYENAVSSGALSWSDQRPTGQPFSHGRVSIVVEFEQAGAELGFLERNVLAELSSRGVSSAASEAPLVVKVRTFDIRNRRVSGFSPMVTFMHFSADVTQGEKTVRIAAYAKNAKVPVWSMREINEPCFNRPLQSLVGELAAKLNRHFVGARASASRVAELAKQANSASGEEQLAAIRELGWSHHPDALAPLSALVSHAGEGVRGVALTALGTLGEPASLPLLKQAYETHVSHTDRFMALAAIGDVGTPEALAYLTQVRAKPGNDADEVLAITNLYTPASGAPAAALAAR